MQGRVTLAAAAMVLMLCATANARVQVGDMAPLYKSFNENMEPIDMADMIKGKPLVLIVGSAS